MIDTERLEILRSEIGQEGLTLLVGVFLDETDQIVENLHMAPSDLAAPLHALRGGALNLGLKALANLCLTSEKAATEGRNDHVDLGKIAHLYQQSRAAFLAALTP